MAQLRLKGGHLCMSALLLALHSMTANAAIYQAENYNQAYDTTPGNQGGVFRNDSVDIEATSDSGGGYNVGWIDSGEWLVYNNFNVPTTGTYKISMRVSSPNGATASVDLNGGSIMLGTLAIPATGGWQNWTTVTRTVTLNAGTYALGVFAATAGWNFNWIDISPVSSGGGGGAATAYQNCDYSGWSANIPEGTHSQSALQSMNFVNDAMSSLRLQAGYEALLFENDWFQGRTQRVTSSSPCISGLNDQVSSMIVRKTGRNLVWSDEFDSINTNTWNFESGGSGNGNEELQYYTGSKNASVTYDSSIGSNVLLIEARKENPDNNACWYGYCQYTSARMTTAGKKTFQYGRIEARMKLPQTKGIWPAFWALGAGIGPNNPWPGAGEIDIMEHFSWVPGEVGGALHGPGYSGNTPISRGYNIGASVSSGYHTYAVEWNTNRITWFVDDKPFYTAERSDVERYGRWVYDQPFFLLLNVAVGGKPVPAPDGSSVFPQRMYVDYIRVYQ